MSDDDLKAQFRELASRIRHSYRQESFDRMTSPAWVADLRKWHLLGKLKPLLPEPEAA